MRWSDPATSDPEREDLGRAIAQSVPALRAVGLFEILELRDERLRRFIADL